MAAGAVAATGMVASSSGRSCGWSCAVRPPSAAAAARHSCTGPRLPNRASSAAALLPGLEALAASGGGADAADASATLLAAAREAAAQHSAAEHSSVYGLQALLASVGAYGAALWPDRPRGWCKKELVEVRCWLRLGTHSSGLRRGSWLPALAAAAPTWPCSASCWRAAARPPLLQVRQSAVAGRGVFARACIAAGTVLGAYPGRPRTPQGMAEKAELAPGARDYCFRCLLRCTAVMA
jgi:hypothetical protein